MAGPAWAIDYLEQRARTFVFSTAPPPAVAAAIDAALDVVADEPERRTRLAARARFLRARLAAEGFERAADGTSQIVPIVIGDNAAAVGLAAALQQRGFDVRAIRPPTVPPGTARLRVAVNAGLSEDQLGRFAAAVRACLQEGEGGAVRRGLFVTGTDTGVGKTVVSAALLRRYGREAPLRYWKPIQTGVPPDDDTAEVRRLAAGAGAEVVDGGVRLPDPVSPHLAAARAGETIDLEPLVARPAGEPDVRWIVEGAGGLLVPINRFALMADLIGRLGLAALVVARSTLGTINHTLLTLEALRARSLAVAGVVMVGDPDRDNREAITRYGRVDVLGELPRLEPLSAAALDGWVRGGLDPGGRLLRWKWRSSWPGSTG